MSIQKATTIATTKNNNSYSKSFVSGKYKSFFSHLNTLSIVLFCPHIFEDGIHGPPVIKLLFKLMRVT